MKKGFEKIKKKIKKINYKKIKKEVIKYLKTNILTLSFLGSNIINGILLRFLTVKNYLNFKPILGDLIILLVVITFAYLIKPKNQFKYYLTWSIIFTIECVANCIYFGNYMSFISFSLIKTSSQLGGYTDAVASILEIKDFIFIWQIIFMIMIHKNLKNKKYYDDVEKIEIGRVRILVTAILCLFFGLIFISTLTAKDYSRLAKQWDRRYTVMEFGVYTYQLNDLISTIRTSMSSLSNSDDAYNEFLDLLAERKEEEAHTNKYTNIFQGKNVLVIHAESFQGFTMNLKFNDEELTPNMNKLASEGIYFSNFYTEESIGNSSDSEFSILTSLLPVSNGTVFVNYFDREYESIAKLLKEKGYYTFSMHGNVASAWNRRNAHKSLGYDKFYAYKDAYEIDEELGLGLSDKSFFRQSSEIIKDIKENNGNFYGTLIMLTNHTPFTSLVDTEYNDDYLVDIKNGDEVIPYLEGTKMGNFLKCVNYADSAIGELIEELDANGVLDDTVIVIYGDHDSKIKKTEFENLYYNEHINDVLIDKNNKLDVVDSFTYEINRKVPFIIWTKDMAGSEYNEEITKVMGIIDVMPTLGNMLGVKNEFALGHDIFDIDENVVVFPNGSFITDKVYYDNSSEEYRQLDINSSVSIEYLTDAGEYANRLVSVSNNIITHDLIKRYRKEQKLFE